MDALAVVVAVDDEVEVACEGDTWERARVIARGSFGFTFELLSDRCTDYVSDGDEGKTWRRVLPV